MYIVYKKYIFTTGRVKNCFISQSRIQKTLHTMRDPFNVYVHFCLGSVSLQPTRIILALSSPDVVAIHAPNLFSVPVERASIANVPKQQHMFMNVTYFKETTFFSNFENKRFALNLSETVSQPYNAWCPQNVQTHAKNLAANAARFLMYV